MPDRKRPSGFDAFDDRLARLKSTQQGADEPESSADNAKFDWGRGLQAGIEIIAGVAGGSLIGSALDHWLGTGPFLMIGGFMLGAAAGMLNAFRVMRRFLSESEDRGNGSNTG